MSRSDDPEIFEDPLSSRVRPVENHYHYEQKKNGNGGTNGATLNNLLLACLLAIIGFLGIQLWGINARLAIVETNVSTLLTRP